MGLCYGHFVGEYSGSKIEVEWTSDNVRKTNIFYLIINNERIDTTEGARGAPSLRGSIVVNDCSHNVLVEFGGIFKVKVKLFVDGKPIPIKKLK